MSKRTLVITAVIVVAALGTALWLWYQSRQKAPAGEVPDGSSYGVTVPVSPSEPTGVDTSGNAFPVATQSGGTLRVQDFTAESRLLEGETKNYLLQEDEGFTIGYTESDQSFFISLIQAPFDTARTNAETAFLQKINLPRERACALKVTVGIPRWASDDASGVNYGLSFCPFSIPVPSN